MAKISITAYWQDISFKCLQTVKSHVNWNFSMRCHIVGQNNHNEWKHTLSWLSCIFKNQDIEIQKLM